MSATAPASSANVESWRRIAETVFQLAFGSGLITAVLFYFGYVRERAFFTYFGVPLGSLDFTTSDYVLRSAQAVFAPLLSIALLGALALSVHELVMTRRHDPPGRRWQLGWMWIGGIAFVLLLVGSVGAFAHSLIVGPVGSALALGAGAVLLDYSAWMASVDSDLSMTVRDALKRSRLPRRLLLTALAVIAVFWWTLNVATSNGRATAQALENSLEQRSEAVVLSDARLAISGHGLNVEPVLPQPSRYSYRYTGLRVLVHTGSQWILITPGWTRENEDSVVLIPETAEGVRIEVRP